ncbi:bifunctional diaminohydroxyphosphoribosylaminopyrimidine deaminase/5-amino-6-(5-phosphoribosylamino)uracil reductase RibD [Tepidibacillus fermentans]|uniref:Riboflavin biosynthesis protein RibD n=1 Tax=Tepidibacillus fermentans TaxID=1281767 RepID=A0A4R3KD42_9BACI|nr:bifunctional diaminohydroxyphosphoribosylaminopyrimidine deaminase/5-amino-6-(5-phosphoribosylamino)uracil reductase RibD [Tepidibacillus fermentans]TCS81067.1 diaminohydroxyphosphoribosylaminopyrimidine deaminase/5-amino-6-(5-phosphoribosylamino)uracil reductase [Tepidibacillus fermentans]
MNDQYYMQLAIDMAQRTKGQTSPNPIVGAVVVNNGRIVGLGTHLKAGEPHAEIHALNMAGEMAKGSTLYVTLEPCSHYGKTPPCAERIIKEKVKRVVISNVDPNPLVAGKGIELMKNAGIEVVVGVLEKEAKRLNETFYKYITSQRPFVTVKTAMTLDGKIATFTGNSQWITGEKARRYVHQLRHEHDAIMVGIGTVLKDNPSLTVRMEQLGIQPIRVVIDTTLKIPMDSKLILDQQAPTWIFTTEQASEEKVEKLKDMGIKVVQTKGDKDVPLKEVLHYLGRNQITSVLVEGGSSLVGRLFDERLIDKYIAFIAPKLIGGSSSLTSIGGKGIENMSDAVQLIDITIERYENDICITGYPSYQGMEEK